MNKKTLTIIGIIIAVIVILVCIVVGMEIKNNSFSESGDKTTLSSDEVLRVNGTIYSKEEFLNYIKYTLYNRDGDTSIDEEAYADQIASGTSKESLFISDTLNSFYQLKVYGLLASQKNVTLTEDDIEEINNEYDTNAEKITSFGLQKEDYVDIAKQEKIMNIITSSPKEYVELPEAVYTEYINQFSGDNLKSYTYRLIQVNYTTDTETESGEMISGDMIEKKAYMEAIVNNIKGGQSFEEAAESGDMRLVYVGNGIQLVKSMEENSAGFLLDQKMGSQEMSDVAKQTPSGELTEIVDTGSAFAVAKIENVEEGIVGKAKEEVQELLISSYANELVYSIVKDMKVNNSALSRIKIK